MTHWPAGTSIWYQIPALNASRVDQPLADSIAVGNGSYVPWSLVLWSQLQISENQASAHTAFRASRGSPAGQGC
jgi:hypothetical protein